MLPTLAPTLITDTIMTVTIPTTVKGFGVDAKENWNHPKLVEYPPRKLGDYDIMTENECCGLCGSDIHTVQGNWGPLNRDDLVVGHEIIGRVIAKGPKVTEFNLGDRVGIGAASFSCGECQRCLNDDEQYCTKGVGTYNVADTNFGDGYVTQGGYSSHSVADQKHVFAIPDSIESKHAAPLMCGGLTVFSPLVRNLGENAKGKKVIVIGLGGLGHMAVMLASKGLGAEVVVSLRSLAKRDQAFELGASGFIATGEEKDWASKYAGQFDLVLNCASGIDGLDVPSYLQTLKVGGHFVTVGAPKATDVYSFSPFTMIFTGTLLGGSLLGSKKEAELMLKLVEEHNIKPWIEEVPISEKGCNTALTRCDNGDVRYRFVFTEFDKAFN